ncbi:hypothetical protein N9U75_03100 [Pelagibacteraceae bacterium]|nr:hypothetical protein [Pelagibacteraceae bacterium]
MIRSGLIATKIGNSSYYSSSGSSVHVTILRVDDCIVSKIKTKDKDGYNAIQLATIDTDKDINKVKKPQRKNFTTLKLKPKKILKEFRVDTDNILELGTKLTVNHFEKDQYVLMDLPLSCYLWLLLLVYHSFFLCFLICCCMTFK